MFNGDGQMTSPILLIKRENLRTNNYVEALHGILGSRENGGQNSHGTRSSVIKSLGSREQRKLSREQGAEEIIQEATQKF